MSAPRRVPGDEGPEVFEGDLDDADFQARSKTVGSEFKHIARDYLTNAGATFLRNHHKIGAYHVEGIVCGANEQQFIVLAHGVIDEGKQAGLRRTDTLKKVGFDAIQIRRLRKLPILLVTSHLPAAHTSAATQLADCAPDIWDVIATKGDLSGYQRLRRYLHCQPFPGHLPAPWRRDASEWEPELFDSEDQPIPPTANRGAPGVETATETY